MRPMQILRRLTAAPPHKTFAKVCGRVKRSAGNTMRRRFDARHATHSPAEAGPLKSYLGDFDVAELFPGGNRDSFASLTTLCERYLDHEFDLLGSGWVNVRHGMMCSGLNGRRYGPFEPVSADRDGEWLAGRLNSANLAQSQSIWRHIDADYVPIDWQLDFKSGYRWNESTWFRDIPLGHLPGVDIKVPWELARMQHLPQMALACCALADSERQGERSPDGTSPPARKRNANPADEPHGNVRQAFQPDRTQNQRLRGTRVSLERLTYDRLAREFRNEVLDFLATNPPRFGVNWQCAMDVGIRVANWLLARDLFIAAGVDFDDDFERIFTAAICDHAKHITANLEWSAEFRGNHYLADVAGLLFAAAYLPCSRFTNAWLAFATRQLIVEVETQFLPDGGNFEASTCYHRLSAEMVVWCTAQILGLDADKRAALVDYDRSILKTKPRLEPAPVPMFATGRGNRGLPLESPFPPWYFDRLQRMTEFIMHTTKPNGRLHQVGDNDSGRFFNVLPVMRSLSGGYKSWESEAPAEPRIEKPLASAAQREFRSPIRLEFTGIETVRSDDLDSSGNHVCEDQLDPRSVVAAANGMFDRREFSEFCGSHSVETAIVASMLKRADPTDQFSDGENDAGGNSKQALEASGHELAKSEVGNVSRETVAGHATTTFSISLPDGVSLSDAECFAHPDFGLYIWRTPRCYFAVRCGPVGQNGIGGHAHNDQLAIELQVDGVDWIADPGTYLYTPDPEARNRYRSVATHFAPRLRDGREPGRLDQGLFRIRGTADGECLYFAGDGFVGRHTGYGPAVTRVIRVGGCRIHIEDYAEDDLRLRPVFDVALDRLPASAAAFSSGYGVLDQQRDKVRADRCESTDPDSA